MYVPNPNPGIRHRDFASSVAVINLVYFSVLPFSILAILGVLSVVMPAGGFGGQGGDLAFLAEAIPMILGGLAVAGLAAGVFLRRMTVDRAAAPGAAPEGELAGRVQAWVIVYVSAADAPAVIGIAFYALLGDVRLAYAIAAYAVIASIVLRPALYDWYEELRRRRVVAFGG